MDNLIKLILLIFIINVTVNAEDAPKRRYCTKSQVTDVMKLACFNSNIGSYTQKRSFFLSASNLRDKEYKLWRKVFNINDNSTIDIPTIALQIKLLFGTCIDVYQKKLILKNLLDSMDNTGDYKNQELTNDHFNNFLNYEPINDNNYELQNRQFRHFKRDTGIVEECCLNSCTMKELKSFCPE